MEVNNIAIILEQIHFDKDTIEELNKFAKNYRMEVTYYYGYIVEFKKTNVYDAFVSGALEQMKEGINIFPFLLGMLVAVNTLKASGMLSDIIRLDTIPSEFMIQGVFRPVSNQAALSLMIDIVKTNTFYFKFHICKRRSFQL